MEFTSHSIRYARVCSLYGDFVRRSKSLTAKLVQQGYTKDKLKVYVKNKSKSKRISFGGSNTLEFSSADFESANTGAEQPIGLASLDDVIWPDDDTDQLLAPSCDLDSDKQKQSVKVFDPLTLEGLAKYIKNGKCKNIVTMVGVGFSASAEIPDYKSPDTDLYKALQEFNLPRSTSVLEIGYFWKNPKPFFYLAKELWPSKYKPTLSHYFIKLLADKGLLLRHYTQNFDTLESEAGVDASKLIEFSGTFRTGHCVVCEKEYNKNSFQDKVLAGEIPTCSQEDCDGIVKPDILLYMEKLPQRFADCVIDDLKKCDLLIVMGTSLETRPFPVLTGKVSESVPRLYIHTQKTGTLNSNLDVWMFGGGFRFDSDDNTRDVFWQGNCDDGCQALADLLGWGADLKKLVTEGHKKYDTKHPTNTKLASVKFDSQTSRSALDRTTFNSKLEDNSLSSLSISGTALNPLRAPAKQKGTVQSKAN